MGGDAVAGLYVVHQEEVNLFAGVRDAADFLADGLAEKECTIGEVYLCLVFAADDFAIVVFEYVCLGEIVYLLNLFLHLVVYI